MFDFAAKQIVKSIVEDVTKRSDEQSLTNLRDEIKKQIEQQITFPVEFSDSNVDVWTPNRIVIRHRKKRIEIFYVNTDTGKRMTASTARSLRYANVQRKELIRTVQSMLLADFSYKPVKPVEYINLSIHV